MEATLGIASCNKDIMLYYLIIFLPKFIIFWIFHLLDFIGYRSAHTSKANADIPKCMHTSQLSQTWQLLSMLTIAMTILHLACEGKVLFFKKSDKRLLCGISKFSLQSGIDLGIKIYFPGKRQVL